eukprot:398992-Prymnesium_polylepis.1
MQSHGVAPASALERSHEGSGTDEPEVPRATAEPLRTSRCLAAAEAVQKRPQQLELLRLRP